MQHIDEFLRRYDPVVLKTPKHNVPFPYMDEIAGGKYVKYQDVKDFLAIISKKLRGL